MPTYNISQLNLIPKKTIINAPKLIARSKTDETDLFELVDYSVVEQLFNHATCSSLKYWANDSEASMTITDIPQVFYKDQKSKLEIQVFTIAEFLRYASYSKITCPKCKKQTLFTQIEHDKSLVFHCGHQFNS